jgi:branched-chain amino acid aminotransferase
MSESIATGVWTRCLLPSDSRLPKGQVRRASATATFGSVFTEHMVTLSWSAERGWHDGRVRPFGPLTMQPALLGLHYGQVVFEGLKVFRQPDGSAAGFRLGDHARRFAASARRLAIPELPEDLFASAIGELVRADAHWVPDGVGRSLYLRPTIYGSESTLALRPAREYTFLLLAFPTEAFFGPDVAPISVWATTRYSRAAPGGTGAAKCAGNYAAGFPAQQEAIAHGCKQVLWLYSAEKRWIEEMGGMNVFWVTRSGTLVTPPLTGTLLPGITRDSILTLAACLGIPVELRRVALEEFCAQAATGQITEAFACGTAAVITPIGRIVTSLGEWLIGGRVPGPVAARLREALVSVQYGYAADPDGWLMPFD